MLITHIKKRRILSIISTVLLFSVLLLGSKTTSAQPVPKIGLCLSGGGAKGLAHIGLLKLIDSLNIKIDCVTGTSMGAVVGGLYASGWSGKQIDSLAHTIDWDVLLNQYVPLNDVSIDERDEYQNYVAEIPIKNRKIQLDGLMGGQGLLNLLTKLTQHVNHISNFDKLPIPFRCMAVDIRTVKPIVMKKGDLALAMRASMSIPTVFRPVKLDSFLLVDGGVMNNFPVKEVKDMGADIIIGSYTGSRLLDESEMNTIDKILLQSSVFYSIAESKDGIKMCSIFNNLTDNMKTTSAGAFKKSNKILKTGEKVAQLVLPQLIDLSKMLKEKGATFVKKDLIKKDKKFIINDLMIDGNLINATQKFILNRIDFEKGDVISYADLDNSVKKIYANRNLYTAYYTTEMVDSNRFDVHYKVIQDAKFKIKGAFHYSSDLGTGVIVNVTARNFLGKNARLLLTIALAESPKYRLHYRKYVRNSPLSFNAQLYREIENITVYDTKGSPLSSFSNLYRSFDMGYNYAFGLNTSAYLGIAGDISNFRLRYTPNFLVTNITSLTDYAGSFSGQLKYNTLDRRVFPRKGVEITLDNKLILASQQSTNYLNYSTQNRDSLVANSDNRIALPHNRLKAKFNIYIPLSLKTTFSLGFNIGFTQRDIFNAKDLPTDTIPLTTIGTQVPITQSFLVGGFEQRSRNNLVPFIGLREGETLVHNFATFQFAIQQEIRNKMFVTPSLSYFYGANEAEDFWGNIKNANLIRSDSKTFDNFYSYGLSLSYKSPLGPITASLVKVSFIRDWRYNLTVGYNF